MKTRFPLALRMIPMLVMMGIIFFLSHQPGDQLDVVDFPFLDKIGHFIFYGLLAATVLLVPSRKFKRSRPVLTAAITVFVCVLYGVTDEFHQSFIPNRYVSVADIVADGLGALCVSLFWLRKFHTVQAR